VGEAAARAAGRLGDVKRGVKFAGPNVKKCQVLSRVVKGKLDGLMNDINELGGRDLTFDASGGRVKEGGRGREGRAQGQGVHKETITRIQIFRKNGIGRPLWKARATPAIAVLAVKVEPLRGRWREPRPLRAAQAVGFHDRCCAKRPRGRFRSATIMDALRRAGTARSPRSGATQVSGLFECQGLAGCPTVSFRAGKVRSPPFPRKGRELQLPIIFRRSPDQCNIPVGAIRFHGSELRD